MSGQHLPPDHSRGDANTLAGYAAVHGRPPAFDGPDGIAYSADILSDETGEAAGEWGAYLFFVRWSAGNPALAGHVESEFLTRGPTAADAEAQLGRWPLTAVQDTLDRLVQARAQA